MSLVTFVTMVGLMVQHCWTDVDLEFDYEEVANDVRLGSQVRLVSGIRYFTNLEQK